MSFNNQIYQLFRSTTKCKWNLPGNNLLKLRYANSSELKFLRNWSLCSKACALGNNPKISTVKNHENFNAAASLIQNFSNSSMPLNQKENFSDKKVKNEDSKIISEMNSMNGTWQEVYKGVLTTQLKLLKMFSLGSSFIGLSMQPILYEKIGSVNLAIVVSLGSFLGFFTFVTPALIHWVGKKYVTKLEYDPKRDVYAATTLSFFLREKKIHFKVDEVIRPDIPGPFTSFLVKNRSLFIDPELFEDLDHYSRIMGLDQPIDFSIQMEQKQKSNS